MKAYPPDFWDWPEEKRDAFFKAEADAYAAKERQATKGNAAGNGAAAEENVATRDNDFDLEISRLAKLHLVDYEHERNAAAKRLGFRATTLDRVVAAERPDDGLKAGSGRPLELPSPEPWHEPVDGPWLVTELTAAIRKYVVLREGRARGLVMGAARLLLRRVHLLAALGDHGAGKAVRQNDSLGCCWPARPPASIDGEYNGRRAV